MLIPALVVALAVTAGLQLLDRSAEDAIPERTGTTAVAEPPREPAAPFRYDVEYPFMSYRDAARADPVAELTRRLESGKARLELDGPRGLLDSLLAELEIDPASQVLVFSTTSLQVGNIRPRTPRAIYFNDDVYVAWVQGGGPIEIASMDPNLGPVFYTLAHERGAEPKVENERCLRCHDSLSLTGGGVPRFIVGSGYIGRDGNIVSHEGWILTTQRTPFRNRFGGWYVTGHHGDQVHLGNIVVRDVYALQDLDRLRIGNIESLDGLVDTSIYAAPGSDIVALLVMQHQIDVQNEISRVNYKVRAAMQRSEVVSPADVAELVEPLVETMLFAGAAPLEGPIVGTSGFRDAFERRGPADDSGRSLRELDLESRLMRYPLSFQIYSEAFDALPDVAKTQVYRRLYEILGGEDSSEKFAHLSTADRAAVLEILAATKPDFAAFDDPGDAEAPAAERADDLPAAAADSDGAASALPAPASSEAGPAPPH